MDFRIPAQGWIIFTKENCKYCTNAKSLVPEAEYVPCDRFLRDCRDVFLARMKYLSGREHRTFPMVFHNGNFIGGFAETSKYVEQMNAFKPVDF